MLSLPLIAYLEPKLPGTALTFSIGYALVKRDSHHMGFLNLSDDALRTTCKTPLFIHKNMVETHYQSSDNFYLTHNANI